MKLKELMEELLSILANKDNRDVIPTKLPAQFFDPIVVDGFQNGEYHITRIYDTIARLFQFDKVCTSTSKSENNILLISFNSAQNIFVKHINNISRENKPPKQNEPEGFNHFLKTIIYKNQLEQELHEDITPKLIEETKNIIKANDFDALFQIVKYFSRFKVAVFNNSVQYGCDFYKFIKINELKKLNINTDSYQEFCDSIEENLRNDNIFKQFQKNNPQIKDALRLAVGVYQDLKKLEFCCKEQLFNIDFIGICEHPEHLESGTPDDTIHAEMVMYCNNKDASYIGVSMLCCAICMSVLKAVNQEYAEIQRQESLVRGFHFTNTLEKWNFPTMFLEDKKIMKSFIDMVQALFTGEIYEGKNYNISKQLSVDSGLQVFHPDIEERLETFNEMVADKILETHQTVRAPSNGGSSSQNHPIYDERINDFFKQTIEPLLNQIQKLISEPEPAPIPEDIPHNSESANILEEESNLKELECTVTGDS